jgi:hypothetical protein
MICTCLPLLLRAGHLQTNFLWQFTYVTDLADVLSLKTHIPCFKADHTQQLQIASLSLYTFNEIFITSRRIQILKQS